MAERILLTTPEQWKPIPFAPHYEVSSFGQVRSYWIRGNSGKGRLRTHPKLMTPVLKKKGKGYFGVGLRIDGCQRDFRVNRLVAMVFIPNPANKPEVNHKDGVKTNNTDTNLEWATTSENVIHAFGLGLARALKGSAHPNSVLTDEQAQQIKRDYRCACVERYGRKRKTCTHGNTVGQLADRHHVSVGTISNLIAGRSHYVAVENTVRDA